MKCPECGLGEIRAVEGSYGLFFGCSNFLMCWFSADYDEWLCIGMVGILMKSKRLLLVTIKVKGFTGNEATLFQVSEWTKLQNY